MQEFILERPVLAVDVVVVHVRQAQLQVLLQTRTEDPFRGALALPGVAIRVDETLANAAKRALREKVGWSAQRYALPYLEQLATFDSLYRDPRGRTISVAYLGICAVRPELAADCAWQPVVELTAGGLPFDHNFVVETALTRLQGKLRYTNIAAHFLPETFRIEELQEVYEAILRRQLNRANFRMKLLKIGFIEHVSILTEAVGKHGGRPPHLYRFVQPQFERVERDFL